MSKSPDAFRTISEVADWLGVPTHVLRFWESKFSQVKPVKRAGGRRYYRPNDMRLLGGIKKLLHEDGQSIKGVQKILRDKGVPHVVALSHPIDSPAAPVTIDVTPVSETVVPFAPRAAAVPAASEEPPEDTQIAMDLGLPPADLPDQAQDELPVDNVGPDQAPAAPGVPETAQPQSPADPVADNIDARPGVLSMLPHIARLRGDTHDQIADLTAALRLWHDRAINLQGR